MFRDENGQPLIEWWRLALLAVWLGLAMVVVGFIDATKPAQAAYRIEVRACVGGQCVTMPTSPNGWDGLYACQTRTDWVADAAAEILAHQPMGLPSPWEVTARCVPDEGAPRA